MVNMLKNLCRKSPRSPPMAASRVPVTDDEDRWPSLRGPTAGRNNRECWRTVSTRNVGALENRGVAIKFEPSPCGGPQAGRIVLREPGNLYTSTAGTTRPHARRNNLRYYGPNALHNSRRPAWECEEGTWHRPGGWPHFGSRPGRRIHADESLRTRAEGGRVQGQGPRGGRGRRSTAT